MEPTKPNSPEEEGNAQMETMRLPHNYRPLQRTLHPLQVETCATANAKSRRGFSTVALYFFRLIRDQAKIQASLYSVDHSMKVDLRRMMICITRRPIIHEAPSLQNHNSMLDSQHCTLLISTSWQPERNDQQYDQSD